MTTLLPVSIWPHFYLWADDHTFVCEHTTTLLSLSRWSHFCLWAVDHTFVCKQVTTPSTWLLNYVPQSAMHWKVPNWPHCSIKLHMSPCHPRWFTSCAPSSAATLLPRPSQLMPCHTYRLRTHPLKGVNTKLHNCPFFFRSFVRRFSSFTKKVFGSAVVELWGIVVGGRRLYGGLVWTCAKSFGLLT